MDQVVQAALLDAPRVESIESQNHADVQPPSEPRPLHVDERLPLTRDQRERHSGITGVPEDELPGGDVDEHKSGTFLIIPDDSGTHDSYPYLRVQAPDN